MFRKQHYEIKKRGKNFTCFRTVDFKILRHHRKWPANPKFSGQEIGNVVDHPSQLPSPQYRQSVTYTQTSRYSVLYQNRWLTIPTGLINPQLGTKTERGYTIQYTFNINDKKIDRKLKQIITQQIYRVGWIAKAL